jgi:UDP-glucose 4-epimerase
VRYDIIFHLAAIARIQPSFKHPVEYFETNTNGTLNVAQYCVKNDIPLIYAGSSSHHSGKFKNPYTFSKDIGEEIIKLYQEHFDLKSSITRFYNVYGPHHLRDGGYSTVIGRWEKQYDDGNPLTIYGDGSKRRDFTHIDDIVNALIKICDKESWGHTFELGRGQNFSLNEVADMFKKDRVYMKDKPGEAQETLCESTLARLILDWKPIVNLYDYIDEYKKKGL